MCKHPILLADQVRDCWWLFHAQSLIALRITPPTEAETVPSSMERYNGQPPWRCLGISHDSVQISTQHGLAWDIWYLMLFLFVAWSMPTNFARFPVSHSTFPCRMRWDASTGNTGCISVYLKAINESMPHITQAVIIQSRISSALKTELHYKSIECQISFSGTFSISPESGTV